MNNLWHTNFRADQEGLVTFRYYLQVHGQFDNYQVNRTGLENHRPLVVAPAQGKASAASLFTVTGDNVFVESMKPCNDGKGILVHLVNSGNKDSRVTIKRGLLEEELTKMDNGFVLPAKEIITIKLL
jgi:alpha-mannosidase